MRTRKREITPMKGETISSDHGNELLSSSVASSDLGKDGDEERRTPKVHEIRVTELDSSLATPLNLRESDLESKTSMPPKSKGPLGLNPLGQVQSRFGAKLAADKAHL